MCQLIGPHVQLVIGELLILEDHRYRLRRPLHLRLKELMNTPLLRILGVGGIPFYQQLVALSLRQERQGGNRLGRIGHDPL